LVNKKTLSCEGIKKQTKINHMTRSELFKAAHKNTSRFEGHYSVRFKAALDELYGVIHKAKLADEKDAAKKKRENQRLLKKGFNVLSMKFGR